MAKVFECMYCGKAVLVLASGSKVCPNSTVECICDVCNRPSSKDSKASDFGVDALRDLFGMK